MQYTEPIPIEVETVSEIHRVLTTVSETAVQTEDSEITDHITTEDSDKEIQMAVTELSHSLEDSVTQILNQDLTITLSQTIITMEDSDPMTTADSDQTADLIVLAVASEEVLPVAEAV